ncbi:MAG: alpha-L-rhamnosidase N-terminal domain-containing protein, partial [Lentisphaeria bacterium]|nr:alpha-L-rhamnosidase N-terminal domain-containing protein [Lentisphaeria bacterium]
EARINGKKITEDCLTPGHPDFYHRTLYQAYDVTSLIKKGTNRLSALLADGWFSGRITRHWSRGIATYGEYPALLAELHLTYEDGSSEILVTDESWKPMPGVSLCEVTTIFQIE